jgi:predicted nucleic acid-binding Zn ribbon protein
MNAVADRHGGDLTPCSAVTPRLGYCRGCPFPGDRTASGPFGDWRIVPGDEPMVRARVGWQCLRCANAGSRYPRSYSAAVACLWCGRLIIDYLRREPPGYPSRPLCGNACREALRRAGRRAAKRATCSVCGEAFAGARLDARYCSNRCRMVAYRARKAAAL